MLHILTHTRPGPRHQWFDACVESVRVARLGIPSVHHIIELEAESVDQFLRLRYLDVSQVPAGDTFCFVDDDDLVNVTAFWGCQKALEQTGMGLAFTWEQQIDSEGEVLQEARRSEISYTELALHPRSVHHLSVMHRDAISMDALALQVKYGQGMEWFLKAEAGLKYGAVQVPTVGYSWRQHKTNYSRTEQWDKAFSTDMMAMGADLRRWLTPRHDMIPVWIPRAK